MGIGNTVSIDAMRPEIWQKELYKDVMDNMYFTQNGMMGADENNIIQVKSELQKSKGDTVTFALTAKLSGNGVNGDSELEGNEEKILAYSEQVTIDQKRFAVRLTGALDEQKNVYDMRSDAKSKLSIRMQEFLERQFFLKLGGVGHAVLTDIAGNVISADYAWSNTPDTISASDTGAGFGARYLCADYANGADSLAATDLLTPGLIDRLKLKATNASPKIQPLKINGKNMYVMFIHPSQAFDLRNNATFAQALREADVRGGENKLFTGALGIWNGVVLHEHEYVPYCNAATSTLMSFTSATAGTQYTNGVGAYRAILCGKQAAGFAQCVNSKGWVEKSFDYENQVGFATKLIGGIQKLVFNSKEYGCVVLDTSATAQV